jgi:hypothetical protein
MPAVVEVRAAAGGSLAFSLVAQYPDGSPVDFTGLTIEAPIIARSSTPPPVAAWTATLTAPSTIQLALTYEQTQQLHEPVWGWALWVSDAVDRLLVARGDLMLLAP